jgi:hypothetical protein
MRQRGSGIKLPKLIHIVRGKQPKPSFPVAWLAMILSGHIVIS